MMSDLPKPPPFRFKVIPVRLLAPNLVTLLALCSGLTSIRLMMEGRLELALWCVIIAAILDTIDGRLARMLKGTSKFGAELDSLTDFVNFGCAPAIILYIWILNHSGNAGWLAALLFAVAAALRLARFNVAIDDPNRPAWTANFFTGMPAPAGAITVLLPIYIVELGLPKSAVPSALVLVYTLAIAMLMVSRVPTFSGKRMGRRISREYVVLLFVGAALFVGLLVSYTWLVMALGTLIYLAVIPLGWRWQRRLAVEEAARKDGAGEPAPEPVTPPP